MSPETSGGKEKTPGDTELVTYSRSRKSDILTMSSLKLEGGSGASRIKMWIGHRGQPL